MLLESILNRAVKHNRTVDELLEQMEDLDSLVQEEMEDPEACPNIIDMLIRQYRSLLEEAKSESAQFKIVAREFFEEYDRQVSNLGEAWEAPYAVDTQR